ncbi:DUF4386 domain-containing protein [Vibrio navarrensis]|nr:DUF4386 domain-containing protein [Vibrio navarrensis]
MDNSMRINFISGVSYLLVIIFGLSSYLLFKMPNIDAIPSNGDFHWVITLDTLMVIFDAVLSVSLFVLFKDKNFFLASLALFFKAFQSLCILTAIIVLIINYNSPLGVKNSYHIYDIVFDYGLIYFSISLSIYSYQIYKSYNYPKLLSFMVMISSLIYFLGSISNIVSNSNPYIEKLYIIVLISELYFCYCLLFYKRE